jgi:Mn-dependent DtxR family transcriptional regulator
MARRQIPEKAKTIYQTVQQNPGIRPSRIAQLLGIHRSEVTRTLPNLEANGCFLSEDPQGGLWPFGKNSA